MGISGSWGRVRSSRKGDLTDDRTIDLERLLKLRVVVGRVGEMDLAQWWNTKGQLGPLGAAVLSRGMPRTHYFAQARSVFAVAGQRCDQIFNPPKSVTLWRLPDSVEERFDARWEHWLDNAKDWNALFEQVAAIKSPDLLAALRSFDLISDEDIAALAELHLSTGARAVPLLGVFAGTELELTLLAAGFSRGSSGSLVVSYARRGDD